MLLPPFRLSRVALLLVALSWSCFALESAPKVVTMAPISGLQWRPGSGVLTYVKKISVDDKKHDVLIAYDPESASEKTLFDPMALTDTTTAKAENSRLPLQGYAWTQRGDAVIVKNKGGVWLIPIPNGVPKRIMADDPENESLAFSPDGKRVAFVKKNNLFALTIETGAVAQLTTDGSDTILNGKLDWVYGEEFEDANPSGRAFFWSPDSLHIAFLRLDQSAEPEYPIVDFLKTHPTISKQRYPKAGDPNAKPSVHIVDVDGGTPPVRMNLPATLEYVLPEFVWTPDSKTLAATTFNRAQNELSLYLWTLKTEDAPKLILQDKDSAWINVYGSLQFVGGSNAARPSFVWTSERDGWLHAYLHDGDGKLIRQLTKGDWMISPNKAFHHSRQPVAIDPAGEWLYFSSTEKDPRERQVCRVKLDGSMPTPERLTKEDGTHFQRLSPDGKFLLETYSSVEQPPMTRLLKADGTVLAILQQNGAPEKKSRGEFHELTAPDGAKLYGRLLKPADFDPAKKYPVIVYVYGGPTVQLVHNSWGLDSGMDQRLAQEGFLIWTMDNRGSTGRGFAWEKSVFKNLGEKELADQLAGVEYLKKMPFVDGSRFGIHGWSYGGYMTLYALTHAPSTFKCGVSGAPVTDWKFYDTIYTERYMRTPTENPNGYKRSSPLAYANAMTAKLLLIHGTSDDNVHMQNSMNFLDALTQHGIPYELQIQPGQKHGFSGEAAWKFLSDRMVDFFKRNL